MQKPTSSVKLHSERFTLPMTNTENRCKVEYAQRPVSGKTGS